MLKPSRAVRAAVRRVVFICRRKGESSTSTGLSQRWKTRDRKPKVRSRMAVGALDPGVPYESRWAPYDRIHGPGQGQFPKGSIRPRGYMAPDARRSLANSI